MPQRQHRVRFASAEVSLQLHYRVAAMSGGHLGVEELVATPVPLPLVVPPRFHGAVLDAVHGLSAGAARVWKGGLAYQFVAVCRRASAEPR